VDAVQRSVRGDRRPDEPRRWRLAFTQSFIAGTIVGSLSLIGWAFVPSLAPQSLLYSDRNVPALIGVSALAIPLGVLATVPLTVQLLRVTVSRNRQPVFVPVPPLDRPPISDPNGLLAEQKEGAAAP
jgi:uncharacterized membrane protein YfcA